jgi:hypothetical protein
MIRGEYFDIDSLIVQKEVSLYTTSSIITGPGRESKKSTDFCDPRVDQKCGQRRFF